MRFFQKQDPHEAERQKRSQEQLARGGLTLDAEHRLRELNGKPGFFTSNLSVSEFVLARKDGVRPLGQVMGSSVFHVGWQWNPAWQSMELATLTHAQSTVRLLALSRLQQEAKLLGAHGVVGVRLERRRYDWGSDLLEFTARGTAVSLEDEPVPKHPFVCALSGQDYFALCRAGFRPVGFAFGTCVWYHISSQTDQWISGGGRFGLGAPMNVELSSYTQAIYTARHFAQSRLAEDAARVRADGIIGVTLDNKIETREVEVNSDKKRQDLLVEFTVYGTSVVQSAAAVASIDYALSLA